MKKLLFALASVAFLVSRSASAAPISFSDWQDEAIVSGDKVFTFVSADGFDENAYVDVSENFALQTHSLNVGGLGGLSGPLVLSLVYRVDITSTNRFLDATLDVTHTGDNVEGVKEVFSDEDLTDSFGTSTSVNGVPGGDIALSGQTIWVVDTISLDGTGSLSGFSNTISQAVPEPSSFVLAGLAVAGLGMVRLRRRKA